jgi:hypothetical protein
MNRGPYELWLRNLEQIDDNEELAANRRTAIRASRRCSVVRQAGKVTTRNC